MNKTLIVVDGNSLMHRAFHGIAPMNAADGTPTNAVFGFLSMLFKAIEQLEPNAVVCAFDAGKPQFRLDALPEYKASRKPMDPLLREQFPIIEEVLAALNIPVIKILGWEGDDILGSVSSLAEQHNIRSYLLTGDRDTYQLVSDLTYVVTSEKGKQNLSIIGSCEVEEKYGVRPDQVVDFIALKGDGSDNIKGIPSIGPKTAQKFLQTWGDLEGLFDHVEELKGKQKEAVSSHKEEAFSQRLVATIVRDIPLDLDLETICFPDCELVSVKSCFDKYGLVTPFKRLEKLLKNTSDKPVHVAIVPPKQCLNLEEFKSVFTQNNSERQSCSLFIPSNDNNKKTDEQWYYFVCNSRAIKLSRDEALNFLPYILERAHLVSLDIHGILSELMPKDSHLRAYVPFESLVAASLYDLSLAAYHINSSRKDFSLETLLRETSVYELSPCEDEDSYNFACAQALLELEVSTRACLESMESLYAYEAIDLPLIAYLVRMERNGVALNCAGLDELNNLMSIDIAQVKEDIFRLSGREFNLDSPKQLSQVLFEEMQLPASKKTKNGYSTDAEVLEGLAHDHEIASLILRYRELSKLKSTYVDALPLLLASDERIHSSFNLTVTATGRLSSSDPNVQNIPVRSVLGRKIRSCFVPLREGDCFVSADYSQIELRLLAHLSGDKELQAAFRNGVDLHTQTASYVFDVNPHEVTPLMRSRAKAVNFGIIYGQHAFGLSKTLHIPFAQAQEMIDRYFEAYPGVKNYLDRVVEEATVQGYAQTVYGRKRFIPELEAHNPATIRAFGARTALNHPMQGSAADIIKLAMLNVQKRMDAEGLNAQMILQVHDELDFSCPLDEYDTLVIILKEEMEGVCELSVPLVVDINKANNWADAH